MTFQVQGTVVMQGFNLQGNYLRITGFEITNVPGNDLNNRTNSTGVYISGSFDEVSNNYIHGTNSDGIYLTTAAGNATVTAETDSVVWTLERSALEALHGKSPETAMAFHAFIMRTMAGRVRRANATIAALQRGA